MTTGKTRRGTSIKADEKKVSPIPAHLYTVKEAAKLLRVSERLIRRLIECRELSHYRINSRVLISQEAINEYLTKHYVPAINAKEIARKILEGRISL